MIAHIKKFWAEYVFLILTLFGIVFYVAGIEEVIKLTPLYLLANMVLLWVRLRGQSALWGVWVISATVGYLAELLGVQTGLLFGDYQYGSVLGLSLFSVPLMVGVMWALVMSVLWSIVPKRLGMKRPLLVGILAVLYDITLEHFATRFDLWQWDGSIPVSNAVGWLAVATCIGVILQRKNYELPRTAIALITLPLHTIFFLILLLA